MVVRTDWCQNCDRLTLTGYVACMDAQLCARCASKVLHVPEEEIQKELEYQEIAQQKYIVED